MLNSYKCIVIGSLAHNIVYLCKYSMSPWKEFWLLAGQLFYKLYKHQLGHIG